MTVPPPKVRSLAAKPETMREGLGGHLSAVAALVRGPPSPPPDWGPSQWAPAWAPSLRTPDWAPSLRTPDWAPSLWILDWAPLLVAPDWPVEQAPDSPGWGDLLEA